MRGRKQRSRVLDSLPFTWPPCISMMRLQIARPIPVPGYSPFPWSSPESFKHLSGVFRIKANATVTHRDAPFAAFLPSVDLHAGFPAGLAKLDGVGEEVFSEDQDFILERSTSSSGSGQVGDLCVLNLQCRQ